MRNDRLEHWVLSLVDDVNGGRRIEDSRVELKSDWPQPVDAARRIAGHGNAAGSDSVLWIIGLDETKGVATTTPTDLADWLPQVEKCFDGVAPAVQDLVVPTASGPVIALLFDVSRRPFVIKNAAYGKPGGGAISREVPWRHGTAVQSARREDLLRMLVPMQALPILESLGGSVGVGRSSALHPGYGSLFPGQESEHLAWILSLSIYVTPADKGSLVLPTHKTIVSFRFASGPAITTQYVRFDIPIYNSGPVQTRGSSTVAVSTGEAAFSGPGLVQVQSRYFEPVRSLPKETEVVATISVSPAGTELRCEASVRLSLVREEGEYAREWKA